VAEILKNNPQAVVVTNTSVANLLTSLGVTAHILEGRTEADVCDIHLEAYEGEHVEIFEAFGLVQNTGYFVNHEFFFPGDAYTVPNKPVRILALPVAGPWCKISDAILYAKEVHPEIVIPVHDATLSEIGKQVTYPHFARELTSNGISFEILEIGNSKAL
jgi:L-ascorbate metabolism protein UlaG (beta-lactamase superfamily)